MHARSLNQTVERRQRRRQKTRRKASKNRGLPDDGQGFDMAWMIISHSLVWRVSAPPQQPEKPPLIYIKM